MTVPHFDPMNERTQEEEITAGEFAIDPRVSNGFVRHAAPCGSRTRNICISYSINRCKKII
jgi:hypothetical protein